MDIPAIKEDIVTLTESIQTKTRAETLLMLLRTKFGKVPAGVSARVKAADAGTLDRWLKQILQASTLDEALAG